MNPWSDVYRDWHRWFWRLFHSHWCILNLANVHSIWTHNSIAWLSKWQVGISETVSSNIKQSKIEHFLSVIHYQVQLLARNGIQSLSESQRKLIWTESLKTPPRSILSVWTNFYLLELSFLLPSFLQSLRELLETYHRLYLELKNSS